MDSQHAESSIPGPDASFDDSGDEPGSHYERPQYGRTLAQVLAVYNVEKESRADLYGTISIIGALGTQHIFQRDRDNCDRPGPDGRLSLIRARVTTSGADPFEISLHLVERRTSPSSDKEISCGRIIWNSWDATNPYDVVQSKLVEGQAGSARVEYVVLNNAAEADITVAPIDGKRGTLTDLYGQIVAENKHGKHTLFDADSVDQELGTTDILARCKIPVSLDDILRVHISLYTRDKSVTNGVETAKGVVEFRPRIFRSMRKRVEGTFGGFEVQVTWF
ncbi:hypothetical protein HIM_01264 [Hirsutella minnesotensis 3608]|nr:hypothetical protein HIM_01264 [Hirsutella minnesotensis 3608]